MPMEDWKERLKAIRIKEEKLREEKRKKLAKEKEEEAKTTEEFIRVVRPHLEEVVSVYKQEDSEYPLIREKTTEFVFEPTKCDLALYMGGGKDLCLRSFKRNDTIYFYATAYFTSTTREGKTGIAHHFITVDKPDYGGNVVFTLKDEHIKEAIEKFLKAYHERTSWEERQEEV